MKRILLLGSPDHEDLYLRVAVLRRLRTTVLEEELPKVFKQINPNKKKSVQLFSKKINQSLKTTMIIVLEFKTYSIYYFLKFKNLVSLGTIGKEANPFPPTLDSLFRMEGSTLFKKTTC